MNERCDLCGSECSKVVPVVSLVEYVAYELFCPGCAEVSEFERFEELFKSPVTGALLSSGRTRIGRHSSELLFATPIPFRLTRVGVLS